MFTNDFSNIFNLKIIYFLNNKRSFRSNLVKQIIIFHILEFQLYLLKNIGSFLHRPGVYCVINLKIS